MQSKNAVAIVHVMAGCTVCINYMYIIWNTDVEVEYTLNNEYYYLLLRSCDSFFQLSFVCHLCVYISGFRPEFF